jgi:hypothetical protein
VVILLPEHIELCRCVAVLSYNEVYKYTWNSPDGNV